MKEDQKQAMMAAYKLYVSHFLNSNKWFCSNEIIENSAKQLIDEVEQIFNGNPGFKDHLSRVLFEEAMKLKNNN